VTLGRTPAAFWTKAQWEYPVGVDGLTVQKSTSAPLMVISLYSPTGQFDSKFLANYGIINLNDPLLRVPGIASVVFGAGQYALRVWVDPHKMAGLNITTLEIEQAIRAQNTVNPAGQVGGEPMPPGQAFTKTVLAQGRLVTEEQFANVVIRASSDGSFVRVKDVGRVELGAQNYTQTCSFNGRPAAALALYQLPGSNAVNAAKGVRQLMAQLKERFPSGLDYTVALDTTLAVTAGMTEIYKDVGGGADFGHYCRLHFPSRLASYFNSVVCRAGGTGQHVRTVSPAWVLGQHSVPPGPRLGHWSGGR
jgi:HAE1 family hydrophobic/amphiphilic exporter-1